MYNPDIKKAGLGDYGVAAVLGSMNFATVGHTIALFQTAVSMVISQLLDKKELGPNDRIDIRIYVTKAGSN